MFSRPTHTKKAGRKQSTTSSHEEYTASCPDTALTKATMKRSAATQPEQAAQIRRGVHPRIRRKPPQYGGYSIQIVEENCKQCFPSTLVDIQHTCSNRRNPGMAKGNHKEAASVSSITKRAERLCALDGAEQLTLKRVHDTWEDLTEHVEETLSSRGQSNALMMWPNTFVT